MAYSAPTAHCAVSSETLMLQVRFARPPMPHRTSSSSCSGVPVGLFGKPKHPDSSRFAVFMGATLCFFFQNARAPGSLRSPSELLSPGGRSNQLHPPKPGKPTPKGVGEPAGSLTLFRSGGVYAARIDFSIAQFIGRRKNRFLSFPACAALRAARAGKGLPLSPCPSGRGERAASRKARKKARDIRPVPFCTPCGMITPDASSRPAPWNRCRSASPDGT